MNQWSAELSGGLCLGGYTSGGYGSPVGTVTLNGVMTAAGAKGTGRDVDFEIAPEHLDRVLQVIEGAIRARDAAALQAQASRDVASVNWNAIAARTSEPTQRG